MLLAVELPCAQLPFATGTRELQVVLKFELSDGKTGSAKVNIEHPPLGTAGNSSIRYHDTQRIMKLSTITCALLGLASQAAATALTYKLVANEKACFFATTHKANEKIAFYFAVRLPDR